MKRSLSDALSQQHFLFRPQHEFICDRDGQLLVDYIGKFEALQDCFDTICRHLQLSSTVLSVHNASERKPVEECYDQELHEMVASCYAQDLILWKSVNVASPPQPGSHKS